MRRDSGSDEESTADKAMKVCLDAIADLLLQSHGECTITLKAADSQIVLAEVGTVRKIKLV